MIENPNNEDRSFLVSCQAWVNVLEQLNLAAFLVDADQTILSINPSAKTLLNVDDTELIGKKCKGFCCITPCHGKCPFHGGEGMSANEREIELLHVNQDKLLITRMIVPIHSQQGKLIGCLTVLQDHSAVSDLIDRLDYEEHQLKAILDNLDLGVFTVNRGGYITFFNTAAEKILGFERETMLGKSCQELFVKDGEYHMQLLFESISDGRTRKDRKGQIISKAGVTVPSQISYMALKNASGKTVGGIVTFKDLTLIHQLKRAIHNRYTFHDMIGKDPKMKQIFDTAAVVADTDATILIEGATGTGKDILAKVIHFAGKRKGHPFVKINCAALPENLLESELFGYVKGAFTGATHDKPGRFQEAHLGTIFLDEIGDLPLSLQAKLLRVLEDKEFYRLGSSKTVKVDVRIISATNQDLKTRVDQRQFREDLYYRLNVFRIELPCLKDRRIDLPLLIHHAIREICTAGQKSIPEISQKAMEILLNYDYPGNVRELENIIEHALIIANEDTIQPWHLPSYLYRNRSEEQVPGKNSAKLDRMMSEDEKNQILTTLNQCKWKKAQTAEMLGIDRTTLWRKMKKYGLSPESPL